jgi:glycosyltransferase involved in cell wall biosynthesis
LATEKERVNVHYAKYFIDTPSRFQVEGVYNVDGVFIRISQELTRRLINLLHESWIDGSVVEELHSIEVTMFNVLFKEELLLKSYVLNTSIDIALVSPTVSSHARIYLNIGFTHNEEFGNSFKNFKQITQMKMVFLVYDMLPLEFPEYFPQGEDRIHLSRIQNIVASADIIIPISEDVSSKLAGLLNLLQVDSKLSSPIRCGVASTFKRQSLFLSDDYSPKNQFIVVGDFEAHRNHLMLLHIWRDFLSMGLTAIPTLYMVGSRVSGNQNVIDFLDRCSALQPYVIELSGLDESSLIRHIKDSRAALFPNYGCEWGFSAAESMTLGIPTICSDIDVLKEATLGQAIYLSPSDHMAWKDNMSKFIGLSHIELIKKHKEMKNFRFYDWETSNMELQSCIMEIAETASTLLED